MGQVSSSQGISSYKLDLVCVCVCVCAGGYVGQREHCKSRGLHFLSMERETKIIN
jgi:hypothetical protein